MLLRLIPSPELHLSPHKDFPLCFHQLSGWILFQSLPTTLFRMAVLAINNKGGVTFVARIFDWAGAQITFNDLIKNFRKRNFFWAQDTVKWKIGSRGMVFSRNHDFSEWRGLTPGAYFSCMHGMHCMPSRLAEK